MLDTYLKTLRHHANLTQRQLAHRAGCNHTTIAHIEAGRTVPGAALLERFAVALDADVDELMRLGGQFDVDALREIVKRDRVAWVALKEILKNA